MKFKKGFSVVEIIIGSAIVTLIGIAIVSSLLVYINMSSKNTRNIQTAILFEETAEALQLIRDKGWDENIATLNTETKYFLTWDGSTYLTTTTQNLYQGQYGRHFTLHTVKRDSGDSISTSGTIDPDTYLVSVVVEFSDKNGEVSNEAEFLVHNVYDN